MASILLNSLKKKNSIQLIKRLKNVSNTGNKAMLSSDESKQLKKFEWELIDTETHTGQTFPQNDYRLVRFAGKGKQVNPRFAIDLIAESPPMACSSRWASCDGGGGPLGHPKVFINLDQPGNHSCGYCGLRFYKEDTHH